MIPFIIRNGGERNLAPFVRKSANLPGREVSLPGGSMIPVPDPIKITVRPAPILLTMKSVDSPRDLFFDQLRDMFSMEMQVLEALPELIMLCHHQPLRQVLLNQLGQVEQQLVEITGIFKLARIPPGDDKCKAVAGLLEGGGAHLHAVTHRPTRDLMMIAHAMRISHYAIAACEISGRLAERLALTGEARTLAMILQRETQTADNLLDLEPEIFRLSQAPSHETPA
jgi:ferritin-like metal-binding protein YciE